MSRCLLVSLCLAASACVPWNEIHGPTTGAAVVYQPDRGVSPQMTVGYGYERYRAWFGYGADAQVAVEPWRRRVTATALLRGSLIFWEAAVGPSVSWSPDGTSYGIAISTGARLSLGAKSNCADNGGSPCLDEDDTVYPSYLPRVHYAATFLRGDEPLMAFGADVIVSSYWLRHREARPADDD